MSKIDLQLKILIPYRIFDRWEYHYIPPPRMEGIKLNYFFSEGGVARGFINGDSIQNEMEIGDELRQTITQENLIVSCGTGTYLKELITRLSKPEQFFHVLMKVGIHSDNYVQKSVIISIAYAKVTSFGVKTHKGFTGNVIQFTFPGNSAELQYGGQDFSLEIKKAEKMISEAGSSITNAMRGIRF